MKYNSKTIQPVVEEEEDNCSLENILSNQIDQLIRENEQSLDIITFAESPNYLNQKLRPVQRFILKIFYNLPLDDKDKYIPVRSFPTNPQGVFMTEVEYCQFLMIQKRINVFDINNFEASQYLLLVCGRRGGKTLVSSIIAVYEAYRLISKGNPQKHYNIQTGQKIKIIIVATNAPQATIAADVIKNMALDSPWMLKHLEGYNNQQIRFRTKDEINKNREPSIFVEAMPCTSSGIRGHTVIVAILDELAHFSDNEGNKSGDNVYNALTPSTATFGKDSKIIAISNPYTKTGIFYTLYQKALGIGVNVTPNQRIRAFQIPSWEMNSELSFETLLNEYNINPEKFDYEYGAEFSTTITGFFKFPEKIDENINENWIESIKPITSKAIHYISIDPAAVGHGYALCMVHIESDGERKKIKVDRWKRWLVNDEEFSSQGINFIDPSVIDEYILQLAKRYIIANIRYDQFESTSSIAKLKRAGLNAERMPKTSAYNEKMYKNLRSYIYKNDIELPNYEHGINELKSLQEIKKSNNRVAIQAPTTGDVVTDDLADVLAEAVLMAVSEEVIANVGRIAGVNTRINKFYPHKKTISIRNRVLMHKTKSNTTALYLQGRRKW